MSKNVDALKAKKCFRNGLLLVVAYLRGEVDIYNSGSGCAWAVEIWNDAWDEIKFLGFDPETVDGIKGYLLAI